MREQKHKITALFQKQIVKYVVIAALVLLAVGLGAAGWKTSTSSEPKTLTIGFEDIGELATQSAYCTEVNVTDSSKEFYGTKLPFTQSKYIYSYDFTIKAGFDFGKITWTKDDEQHTIEVKLPEAKILSNEIDMDSFKLYHEQESIFNQIKLEDTNSAIEGLKKEAETKAIANGLLENARDNAKIILKGFFANAFDLDEYTITFTEK